MKVLNSPLVSVAVMGLLIVIMADEVQRGHASHAVSAYLIFVLWIVPVYLRRKRNGRDSEESRP